MEALKKTYETHKKKMEEIQKKLMDEADKKQMEALKKTYETHKKLIEKIKIQIEEISKNVMFEKQIERNENTDGRNFQKHNVQNCQTQGRLLSSLPSPNAISKHTTGEKLTNKPSMIESPSASTNHSPHATKQSTSWLTFCPIFSKRIQIFTF